MNIAGALGYLFLQGWQVDPVTITRALAEVGDETVDEEVLRAVAPIAESISALFRPVQYDELRATGRTGLISLNREVLAQALAASPEGTPEGDRSWAKAVEIGDDVLIYPQDRRSDVRLVLWVLVAVGPNAVRLTPFDLGIDIRPDAAEPPTVEPPAVEPQPCAIVFTGSGDSLRRLARLVPVTPTATRSGECEARGCGCSGAPVPWNDR